MGPVKGLFKEKCVFKSSKWHMINCTTLLYVRFNESTSGYLKWIQQGERNSLTGLVQHTVTATQTSTLLPLIFWGGACFFKICCEI